MCFNAGSHVLVVQILISLLAVILIKYIFLKNTCRIWDFKLNQEVKHGITVLHSISFKTFKRVASLFMITEMEKLLEER